MTAPAQSPSTEEPLYDMVDEPASAAPSPKSSPAPVVPATSNVPPQPVLGYQTKRDASSSVAAADEFFPNPVKDFQIPLVLLCVGVVVESIAAVWTAPPVPGWAATAVLTVGASIIIGTALMLIAVFIAAKFRGLNLGRFWPAVLKLSAISVAPSAAMTLLHVFLRFIPFGGLVTWIAGFVFYFALIGVFFDLEESDTWYVVFVAFLTKLTVALLIIAALAGKFW
jgi:hypothetical protein